MKYPGGNPSTMFCEQVGTVTSLFEQWNDCERTVVLYALLKRVPFANLKFLQVSIDYNLAQNYSTQSKLLQLETKANSTALLSKLVQKYYRLSGHTNASASLLIGGPHLNNNNNNTHSVNNNLKTTNESSSLYDLLKKSEGIPLPASSDESPSSASSSSRSVSASVGTTATITVTASSVPVKNGTTGSVGHEPQQQQREPETMEDILKDILMYLPLLAPGNDEAKSMYMSLIPAAVDDACRQLVPTEIVQQTLSYLLIHPAITNDDRRVLSHWLRYLEDFISTSYLPPSSAATITKNRNFFNLQQTNANAGSNGSNNGSAFPAVGNTPAQQFLTTSTASGGGLGLSSWNANLHPGVTSLPLNQPSLLTGPPHHQHHHHAPPALPPVQQNGQSALSKSQQSLNQTTVAQAGGNSNTSSSNINSSSSSSSSSSSTTSSSSCLDSGASQLLKCASSPRQHSDWTIAGAREDIKSSNEFSKTIGQNLIASSQALLGGGGNVVNGNASNGVSLPGLLLHNNQQQRPTSTTTSSSSAATVAASNTESEAHHDLMAATESLLYDSTDDHHISFSKNGTEIFDYDCDFENEDEFNFLTRNAAAIRAASSTAVPHAASAGSGVSGGGKKLVSFDSNVSDFLRVPPLPSYGHHHHHQHQQHLSHGAGDGGGLLDLDLDGTLMKTRRSNSLTTPTTLSALGGVGDLLHPQQKQNNECLSAENLTNLQLLQNKPRSFSLTMESPRSSLASSGSDTQLDDYKQGSSSLMKLYGGGPPNVGMSSIAHWLKSLRLHKYVWLFSNLTYDKMLSITEEYLQSLGVTKGARHKLAICIQKLNERYGTLLQLEKDLIAGQKAHLGTVLEELTNIVLTPMKPIGMDQQEDIAGQFVKVLDLVGSIILMRPVCSQQDEEYLNIFMWIVERALHNDAFLAHSGPMKEHKFKVSKIKMQLTPKGHFAKNTNVAGPGINKPRWSVNNKHKPANLNESQSKPHRKSSVPYFVPPGHGNSICQPQSQTLMQAMAHQYFHHGNNNSNGTANYNKSSSYPSFASTLHNGSGMKPSTNTNNPSIQQQQSHQNHPQSHSTQVPPPSLQQPPPPAAMQHPNFMFHRHSLSSITHHNPATSGPLVPPPPIFMTNLGPLPTDSCGPAGMNAEKGNGGSGGGGSGGVGDCGVGVPNEILLRPGQSNSSSTSNSSTSSSNNNNSGNSHNSSIVDINSRLEFLCRQMTEQAIN